MGCSGLEAQEGKHTFGTIRSRLQRPIGGVFLEVVFCHVCATSLRLSRRWYLKNIDVTNAEMRQQVLSLIDIFKKQAVRVVCDPKAEEGSAVASFLEDDLHEVPQFHFA